MNLFETVKNSVTAREAAERYGLQVHRNGFCTCPFHDDHHPSMKVDRRYHCFGCQADGDVIDFVGRLFSLSPKDAALKLASDFSIRIDRQLSLADAPKRRNIRDQEGRKHQESYAFSELTAYREQLLQWKEEYAPRTPEDELHPRFQESLVHLEQVENDLDVLLMGTEVEKKAVIEEVLKMERTRQKESMESVSTVPVYYESAAYAREHGELEPFRISHRASIDCKNVIQDAIARHFDGMHLSREAVQEVFAQYGQERVFVVLAATVQAKAWDGRFSSANKGWAFSVPLPDGESASGFDRRDDYVVTSHPAVLDGFISMARRALKEREQAVADVMTSEPTASTKTKLKHHDPER